MVESDKRSEFESLREGKEDRRIILHNDDVNTFDYVIEVLCAFCDHDALQAEQCAMITHFNGMCSVKKGSIDELLTVKELLQKKGLLVTLE